MSTLHKVMISLVAIAGLVLIGWAVSQLERVEVTREGVFRGEAYTNSFLAAERLLSSLGLPTESESTLRELPPTDHTLLMSSTGITLEGFWSDELAEWVTGGGNLVLLLPSDDGLRDLFVEDVIEGRKHMSFWDKLGIEVAVHDDVRNDEFEWLDSLESEAVDDDLVSQTKTIDLGTGLLRIQLDDTFMIFSAEADADLVEDSEELVRIRMGAGLLTVLASDGWAQNDLIGEFDHARFLSCLARPDDLLEPARKGAVLVRRESTVGLFTLLGREAWTVLLSGGLLLALWIWSRGRVFGPRLPDPPRIRRDFSEHIEASSEYLWRNNSQERLLAAPRGEFRRRLVHTRPAWARTSDEELADNLSSLCSLSVDEITEALSGAAHRNSQTFTRVVNNLSLLRRSL